MATCLTVSMVATIQAKEPITPTDGPIDLLADNLGKLYSWLKESQYEDPKGVFWKQDGTLRISGDGWGALTS